MTSTTPINNIKIVPKPKPVTNYDRLLRVLEANAASAREPELVQRLKLALRAIESKEAELAREKAHAAISRS